MKKFNRNAGITLIALVITIIILLILAGVTIAAISGDNGILQNAARAKEETEQAEKDEKEKLGDMEDTINGYATGITVEQVTDENPGVLEGTGTDDDPYIINSIEDLVAFASNVTNGTTYEGQTVKLGLSLDFNSNKSYVNPVRTDYEEYGYNGELKALLTTGEGFKTIGTTEENPFIGEFDGKGNSIIGLNIKSENGNQGFFCNNEGSIKNLNIINSKISGNYTVGSIVAINKGKIQDCLSQGVELTTQIGECGGICGKSSGKIEGCVNKSNITGIGSVGGIVAVNIDTGDVLSCYNIGEIYANQNSNNLGGITGLSDGNVENCYNLGRVYGKIENSSGGIVGFNQTGIVNNCYNLGVIEGINNVGGIVGSNYNEVNNSYNTAEVKSQNSANNVGAVIGSNTTSGKVSNCYYSTEINAIGEENGVSSNILKLKTEEMPDVLSIVGTKFKDDTNKINNGYPILTWQ